LQARIRNHRWYERVLKSRDPLIISCGWRRFQTMVIYATEDRNGRFRFFKYTPSHEFCHGESLFNYLSFIVHFIMATVSAIFYGPIITKGNGLLGIQSVDEPEQVSLSFGMYSR
jgi:ribosome biogenesis protein BMS1